MTMAVLDHSYLHTFAHCEREFHYKYVLRREPLLEAPYLVAGRAGHAAFAVLYSSGWDLQAASEALEREYTIIPGGDYVYLTLAHLRGVLEKYVRYWKDRDVMQVVQVCEEPVTREWNGLLIGGRPDLIAVEYGERIVVDHKFTTGYVQELPRFSHQGRLYAWLTDTRKCVYNHVYMGKYALASGSKATPWFRQAVAYTPGELDETLAWVLRMKQGIEQLRGDGAQNVGRHCNYCAYRDLCASDASLRDGILERDYRFVGEPTGVLASGADSETHATNV